MAVVAPDAGPSPPAATQATDSHSSRPACADSATQLRLLPPSVPKSPLARLMRGGRRITGRSGPLWARRADIQPILDDEAAAQRVAYCVANPAKAKLVADPEQWPGLNVAFSLQDSDELQFEYFDHEAWHEAHRPKEKEPFYANAHLTPHLA